MNHLGADSFPLILSRLPYGPEVSHARRSRRLLRSPHATFKLHRLHSTAAGQRPLQVRSMACLRSPDSVDEGREVKAEAETLEEVYVPV